jgi:hypothetical protein
MEERGGKDQREIYTKYTIHKNKPLSCTERNHYLNQCLVFILVHRTPVVHQPLALLAVEN